MDEVAQLVFLRKRLVEVHYFRATISDEQRQEFATHRQDGQSEFFRLLAIEAVSEAFF